MTTNPLTTTPPTIPTLALIGGAALIDDPDYPPIPTQQPTADQLNLHDICSAWAALVMPFAILKVHVSGITYSCTAVFCPNANITTSDVTFNRTGTGQVEVIVTSGKLPVKAIDPLVWGCLASTWVVTAQTATGATVHMTTWATSIIDRDSPFFIALWGTT
jgi:hypothetical protein